MRSASPSQSQSRQRRRLEAPKELNLDRKAQLMVEEVRLKNIEKEHRSVGAMLDKRTLIPLEKPKSRARAQMRMEQQGRVDSRRGAAGDSEAIKTASESALKQMAKLGIDVVKTSNFENEELIWATKARDPSYSQKRRYYEKDLHDFKENMTAEQRLLFKQQTKDALYDLAAKYREDMALMKDEMDLAGIFHPDANAHRAHCMYLLKLYKGIRADTIEDPVLRKLRREEADAKRQVEEEERRQQELIASIENKGKGKDANEAPKVEPAIKEARETKVQIVEPVEPVKPAPAVSSSSPEPVMRKSASTSKVSGGPVAKGQASSSSLKRSATAGALSGVGKGKASSSSQKIGGTMEEMETPAVAAEKAVNEKDEKSVARSVNKSEKSDEHALHPDADTKLFAKIKRGKLSAADPKTLLLEEAARLATAEVTNVRKQRERSNIVDAETTQWMLSLLQSSQITKTAQGRDVTHALDALSLDGRSADPDHTSSLHNSPPRRTQSPSYQSRLERGRESPERERVIPFQEFVEMFRTYEEEARVRKEAHAEAERRKAEKRLHRQQHHHHHQHDDLGDELDGLGPPTSHVPFHHGHNGEHATESPTHDSAHVSYPPDHEALSHDHAQPHAQPHHSEVQHAAPAHHQQQQQQLKPLNVVALMRDTDPQFDAYYKMSLRQKPQGARLFTGLVNKVGKIKHTAPLGKNAVTILDSKGKVKPITSKGFYNVFSTRDVDDSGSEYSSVASVAMVTRDTNELGSDDDVEQAHFPGASPPASAGGSPPGSPFSVENRGGLGTANTSGSRTPTSRRKNRSRDRRSKPGALKDDGTPSAPAVEDMQQKLICVWDCLQMPALSRLSFMRKYASHAFAAELSRATDMWAEVAVLCLARINIVDREVVKIKEGYAVLPLASTDLLGYFTQTMPKILYSNAPNVCVQLTATGPIQEPLSVAMLRQVKAEVQTLFPPGPSSPSSDGGTDASSIHALTRLDVLRGKIDAMLTVSCERVYQALRDTPSFAGLKIDEWLHPPLAPPSPVAAAPAATSGPPTDAASA